MHFSELYALCAYSHFENTSNFILITVYLYLHYSASTKQTHSLPTGNITPLLIMAKHKLHTAAKKKAHKQAQRIESPTPANAIEAPAVPAAS